MSIPQARSNAEAAIACTFLFSGTCLPPRPRICCLRMPCLMWPNTDSALLSPPGTIQSRHLSLAAGLLRIACFRKVLTWPFVSVFLANLGHGCKNMANVTDTTEQGKPLLFRHRLESRTAIRSQDAICIGLVTSDIFSAPMPRPFVLLVDVGKANVLHVLWPRGVSTSVRPVWVRTAPFSELPVRQLSGSTMQESNCCRRLRRCSLHAKATRSSP